MRSIKCRALAGVGAALVAGSLLAPPAHAVNDRAAAKGTFSFAVIGDVPYRDAEFHAFPSYIQDINAHRELSFVAGRARQPRTHLRAGERGPGPHRRGH
ncbi:hypothetical protein QFZ23_000360 [Arthrobacter globiformis]|uniref:hypothetical protein n=1 Tax=Arthrobacter globiformis TaxID=1665 RepID=UPI0027884123|nr:hypothetical protein [Arthrobacter globiformis]MDQ1056459.1 hypothetical protein [Arthrobacter globiformis]